jgi:hypothetical protein
MKTTDANNDARTAPYDNHMRGFCRKKAMMLKTTARAIGSGTSSSSGIIKSIAVSSLRDCAMAGRRTDAPAATPSKMNESFRIASAWWPND